MHRNGAGETVNLRSAKIENALSVIETENKLRNASYMLNTCKSNEVLLDDSLRFRK